MLNGLIEFIRTRPLQVAGVLGGLSFVLLVTMIVALLAGGDGDPQAGRTSTTTTTVVPLVVPPDGTETTFPGEDEAAIAPVDRNPLTGAPLDTPSDAQIIAIKVDNGPSGRPQIGLDRAEMIIEAPAEGGLTRFTALYFAERPDLVGPVRSMRSFDADVLAPFDPLFVTTGGQDFVYRALKGAEIEVVDQNGPNVFQSLERPVPSHLMATLIAVEAMAVGGPPATPPLSFADEWSGGEGAGRVEIPFSSTTMVEYKFEDGRYRRYENGDLFEVLPTFDGDPVALEVDTIVVQFAAQRSAGYSDSTGADVPTFDVIGFGRVLVFHQGEVVEGSWQRGAQVDLTVLTGAGGDPLSLPTGVVLWTIVPRSLEVAFE